MDEWLKPQHSGHETRLHMSSWLSAHYNIGLCMTINYIRQQAL